MRPFLAILAAVLLLLLAGCGQTNTPNVAQSSAAHDPFVGTWRLNPFQGLRWVIGGRDGKYTVVQGATGQTHYTKIAVLSRHGNQLSGRALGATADQGASFTLLVAPAPGRLYLNIDVSNTGKPGDMMMTRLSGSTATPTPVP
jgi:hypothetical protein